MNNSRASTDGQSHNILKLTNQICFGVQPDANTLVELNQATPVYGNLKVELIMLHCVAPQLIHLYEIDYVRFWDPSLVLVRLCFDKMIK